MRGNTNRSASEQTHRRVLLLSVAPLIVFSVSPVAGIFDVNLHDWSAA